MFPFHLQTGGQAGKGERGLADALYRRFVRQTYPSTPPPTALIRFVRVRVVLDGTRGARQANAVEGILSSTCCTVNVVPIGYAGY